MAELPLRIIDGPGGAAIRCLCGAELASVRRHAAHQMTGLRAAPAMTRLSPDVSAQGLLRMILHAKSCAAGQARMAVPGG